MKKVLFALFFIALLFSCEKEVEKESLNKWNINIATDSVSLQVGENYQLEYATNTIKENIKSIIWESQDKSIVEVDELGRVHALKIGKTTIICKALFNNGYYAEDSCYVKCNHTYLENIRFESDTISIKRGNVYTNMKLYFYPENATDLNYTLKIEDESIAGFQKESMNIIGYRKGSTKLFAELNGQYVDTCYIQITPPILEFVEFEEPCIMEIGTYKELKIKLIPSDADSLFTIHVPFFAKLIGKKTLYGVQIGGGEMSVTSDQTGRTTFAAVSVSDFADLVDVYAKSIAIKENEGYITGYAYMVIENNSSKNVRIKDLKIIDTNGNETVLSSEYNNTEIKSKSVFKTESFYIEKIFSPLFSIRLDAEGREYGRSGYLQ